MNDRDKDDNSPFLYAIIQHNEAMVKLLIEYVNENEIFIRVE